jgi:hypothetical protein
MSKKLIIAAAVIGVGYFFYKKSKNSPSRKQEPLKTLNFGEQLIALSKSKAAARKKEAATNPPVFSMTNPTYNA